MRFHLVSDEDFTSERPKLGLGYLASYLEKYFAGIKLTLSLASDNLLFDIKKYQPDIIGFSSLTHTFNKQMKKAKMVKEKTGLPIIIGGVHISLVPESLPRWVDVGVISEGEEILLRLLKSFKRTGELKKREIPSLLFWEKEKLIKTGPPLLVEPIDKIPHPDWDFLKIGKSGPGHIMTSRGCPYHCRFCESGNFWKKYRLHSPEYVVEEIKMINRKYGRSDLVIMDDLFFINKQRLMRILDLLEKNKLNRKMRFEVIGRADLFNEEIAKILQKMNVRAISFGMESGSEKILSYLKNETVSLEQIRRGVKLAKKYKMEILGTFMIGSPGETEDDIHKTIEFIKELDLDQVGVNVTTPFPGTELWEVAKKKGLVKDNRWDDRLWGMRDLKENNLSEKLLLTDIPKQRFWKLTREMFMLQDRTHRRRRNQQLWRDFVIQKKPVQLVKFIGHCLKRPKEAVYNLKKGCYRI